ncbi:hypothetical protein [Streptomyces cadmiisoli]|uniref:hypothetical protein n=1 Tax=Streptomyces cadmiisoli TaxID=2184053 RepID=UPI00365FCADC
MKRSSGARWSATVAVSALSLALITGCSEAGSDDSGDSKGSGSGSSAAAKALSATELKKLIIAEGDVEGYKVEATDASFPKAKSEVKVDKAECEPLAFAMAGLAPGDSSAEASSQATEEKKPTDTASDSLEDLASGEMEDALTDAMSVKMTVVGLSSYEGDGAEKTFKSVSDAVAGCAGGFTVAAQGEEQKLTGIASVKASGTGDESVRFSSTAPTEESGGEPVKVLTEVVRHGGTIATYYVIDLGSMLTGKDPQMPTPVIEAQAGKLK